MYTCDPIHKNSYQKICCTSLTCSNPLVNLQSWKFIKFTINNKNQSFYIELLECSIFLYQNLWYINCQKKTQPNHNPRLKSCDGSLNCHKVLDWHIFSTPSDCDIRSQILLYHIDFSQYCYYVIWILLAAVKTLVNFQLKEEWHPTYVIMLYVNPESVWYALHFSGIQVKKIKIITFYSIWT